MSFATGFSCAPTPGIGVSAAARGIAAAADGFAGFGGEALGVWAGPVHVRGGGGGGSKSESGGGSEDGEPSVRSPFMPGHELCMCLTFFVF